MKIRLGNVLITVVAAVAGWITLLGYFVGQTVPPLYYLRVQLVSWAVLLAAVALCLGAVNLGAVHIRKIIRREPGGFYSVFILLGLFMGIVAGFVPPLAAILNGAPLPLAPESSALGNPYLQWVFRYIQSALGAAISGLIVFFLVFAGMRLMRRRTRRLTTLVFIVVAILALVGMTPFGLGNPQIDDLRMWLWVWISQVPAVAGARGLLIGIALGAIATGLRVLLAIDRPYGE